MPLTRSLNLPMIRVRLWEPVALYDHGEQVFLLTHRIVILKNGVRKHTAKAWKVRRLLCLSRQELIRITGMTIL